MGGIGSGRVSSYPTTVESTRRIDIRFLRRKGWLNPGWMYSLNWTSHGEPSGDIRYLAEEDRLILKYRYREGGGEWESVEQPVRLETTPCRFGGVRHWFSCPRCHRRCEVLCGADKYFYCRKCYGLPYQTQLEGPHGRACIKRDRLEDKLWGDNRRRMWDKTWQRLYRQYRKADDEANLALIADYEDMCARLGLEVPDWL